MATRSRDILRINAYVSLVAALGIFAVLVPPAGRAGMSWLGIAGFVVVVVLAAGDELFLSVGRRLRRWHLVPFALVNAVSSTACVALLASADGLSILGRSVVVCAAVLFATFAILETRAARTL